MKTPDYMSYTKYKKKKNNNSKKAIVIFITTFFITLLFLVIMATHLSPNVDVSIGEGSDVEAKESGLGVKKFIDDRLKTIQMEDNGSSSGSEKLSNRKTSDYNDESFDSFSKELDQKVVIPKQRKDNQASDQDIEGTTPAVATHTPPRPHAARDLSTPFESKMAKVYVGYYNTAEQAKVAQGILLDAGLNITPFIKDLGGTYTLQVGSYSTRSKAESLASELLRNNFPARISQE